MRLLKNEKTEDYHEIEVEFSFLWFKWKKTYRKIRGTIWRYKAPDNYYDTGLLEYLDVNKLFNIGDGKSKSKPEFIIHYAGSSSKKSEFITHYVNKGSSSEKSE